jgi:hypothetical protein
LIVLNTSILGGNCYIETASLDGEKNLKPKNSHPDTISWFKNNGEEFTDKMLVGKV